MGRTERSSGERRGGVASEARGGMGRAVLRNAKPLGSRPSAPTHSPFPGNQGWVEGAWTLLLLAGRLLSWHSSSSNQCTSDADSYFLPPASLHT